MATPKLTFLKKIHPVLLWGGVGLLALILGMAAALYIFAPGEGSLESRIATMGERLDLQSVFDDLDQTPTSDGSMDSSTGSTMESAMDSSIDSSAGTATDGRQGMRRYRVQEGDNLWAIARKGNLVDEPWEWRTIMVQNQDKIDYAFLSEFNGEWKVLIETGQELTVHANSPLDPARPVAKKFAIQLTTVPEDGLAHGLKIVKALLEDGYYGYLYRIDENGFQGYRVRVGFFETKLEAEQSARRILATYAGRPQFPQEFWVVVPSDRELRGQLLDFGAQLGKPWVIELPRLGTHAEALQELRQTTGIGEFVYIAQGRGLRAAKFIYRTRIGFFETAAAAQAVLDAHRDRLPQLEQARVVELRGLAETLPGQRFKTNTPRS